MSKKGGDKLQMPDYTPLMAAAQKAQERATELAEKQFKWAQDTYAENKARIDKVSDFMMSKMEQMSGWAEEDRKVQREVNLPLQLQLAGRAQDANDPKHAEYMAGLAEAEIAKQYESARQAAADKLESFGIDPGQIRMAALDTGTRLAQASAQVAAGNQARLADKAYADQLLAGATSATGAWGQQALAEIGASGSAGTAAINAPLAGTASGASTMGTAPGYFGSAGQSLGQQAQMLNAGWDAQLKKKESESQDSSGFGAALGGLASIAGIFVEKGGVIPKRFAAGGGIPDDEEMGGDPGTAVPEHLSPSGGAITDDIVAHNVDDGSKINVNAGEFVIPKDVVAWLGEKGMQQLILKARKEMGDPDQAPAQPEVGPPGGAPPEQQPIPGRGVGAIPEMEMA